MQITLFDANGHRNCQTAELSELLASEDHLIWADIVGPGDEDIRIMRDVFAFHPLAIEDTRNHEQRPKVEEYPGYLFLIVNPVELAHSGVDLNFHELDIFVGRNYVVTVHTDAIPVIDRAVERIKQTTTTRVSVGFLMYTLLDIVVDDYFPIMDMVEEEINQLEDVILARPRQNALTRVFALKRMLLQLWRVVWPERDILSTLTQPHVLGFADRDTAQFYLRDVADHLYWIADMIGMTH